MSKTVTSQPCGTVATEISIDRDMPLELAKQLVGEDKTSDGNKANIDVKIGIDATKQKNE